jgi:hypothetical protein
MRKTLLNLFAMLLLPHAFALGQGKTVKVPVPAGDHNPEVKALEAQSAKPAEPAPYTLTDLQKARLDAARQKIWRWQDKLQEALSEFGGLCADAAKENKWPPVTCNWDTLAVTPQPAPPSTAPPALPAQPAPAKAPPDDANAPKK